MLLMKQARAFGVGVVLSTQNPVDVDYKALSNAGTWMVGRLQTDRDKQRLLDGMSAAAGGVDVAAVGDTISGLGQAGVRAAPGRQGPPRGVHDALGDELPARPDDPRPDQAADAGRSRRRRAAGAGGAAPAADGRARRRAAASRRRRRPTDADVTPVMPEVAGGVAVRWVDPAAPWLGAVGGDPARHGPRGRARRPRRPALRRGQGRPRRTTRSTRRCCSRSASHVDVTTAVAVDYDDRDLLRRRPRPVPRTGSPTRRSPRRRSGSRSSATSVDHLARSLTHGAARSTGSSSCTAGPASSVEDFAARCALVADDRADAERGQAARQVRGQGDDAAHKIGGGHRRRRGRPGPAARPAAATTCCRRPARSSAGCSAAAGPRGGLLGQLGRAAGRSRARRRRPATRVDAAKNKVGRAARTSSRTLEAELAEELTEIDARWTARATQVDAMPIALERTDVKVTQLTLAWIPVRLTGRPRICGGLRSATWAFEIGARPARTAMLSPRRGAEPRAGGGARTHTGTGT